MSTTPATSELTGPQATPSDWWAAVRQAFGLNDYVSDAGVRQWIVGQLAQTIPEVTSQNQHFLAQHRAQEAWNNAGVIVDRVCSLGSEGKLDDLFLPSEKPVNREPILNSIGNGTPTVFYEDHPMINLLLDRLAEWIDQNPRLPRRHVSLD